MKDGMVIDQRDIILMPFPYTNLSSSKKRPVLILSNSKYHKNNNNVICCPLTSSKKFFQEGILIDNNNLESRYLKYTSIIKPSIIFTILQERIIKKIGRLNIEKTKEVIKNLNYCIEIEE